MKTFDRLIRVSKASFMEKLFDVDEKKLSKAERKKIAPFLPTDEEREFKEIYVSNMPQLARLQRKMGVCLKVEVTELEEDRVTFLFGRDTFTLLEPTNVYKMCQVLERGNLEAVGEMIAQGCVLKNGSPVDSIKGEQLKVDELRLILDIASQFFFQTFLA